MTEAINVIYPPPRGGLRYLIVTLVGQDAEIIPARNQMEARSLAVSLSRKKPAPTKRSVQTSN